MVSLGVLLPPPVGGSLAEEDDSPLAVLASLCSRVHTSQYPPKLGDRWYLISADWFFAALHAQAQLPPWNDELQAEQIYRLNLCHKFREPTHEWFLREEMYRDWMKKCLLITAVPAFLVDMARDSGLLQICDSDLCHATFSYEPGSNSHGRPFTFETAGSAIQMPRCLRCHRSAAERRLCNPCGHYTMRCAQCLEVDLLPVCLTCGKMFESTLGPDWKKLPVL